MGVALLKLGKASPLLAGERVLHEQRRFRAVSSTCKPSYRIACDVPPLVRIRLVVTNCRCIVVTRMFHCMVQEIGMWYPGRNPDGDPETITSVSCQGGLLGRCLEIRSHNPTRRCRFIWSPDLTLRFYFKNPEAVESVILEAMKREEAVAR